MIESPTACFLCFFGKAGQTENRNSPKSQNQVFEVVQNQVSGFVKLAKLAILYCKCKVNWPGFQKLVELVNLANFLRGGGGG